MPVNALFSFLIKKRLQQIELFRDNPEGAQLEVFTKLIQAARFTEWGRHYDYASITTPDQFRERVPLQHYDDVKPYVDRLRKGEQNLLWPTEIKWFSKSSGTTNDRSKYIPVSREALEDCHYKGGKDLIALHYQMFPQSKLYQGMSMVVGGSSALEQFRPDAYSGDLSAIIIRNLPIWVEMRRTPILETALMEGWEEKVDRMAHETMREDVRTIAGVPSWTLVILRRILELTGKRNIMDVWPNLELFMHGGVSFRPYRDQFKALIPSPSMNYLESYNASEGYFAIQDRRESDDLLLMLDYGIFFEFVPVAEMTNERPRTVLLQEVKAEIDAIEDRTRKPLAVLVALANAAAAGGLFARRGVASADLGGPASARAEIRGRNQRESRRKFHVPVGSAQRDPAALERLAQRLAGVA